MSLIQEELEIINIKKLMELNLKIPEYQRPYRWSSRSVDTLFTDTYEAFKSKIDEYRLGSVILHKEESETKKYNPRYNLVDGQQRTTTLSILLFALGEDSQALLNEGYSISSRDSIQNNFALLQKRIKELSEDERDKYKRFLKENCKVVKIVTDSEQEAFQFFDSQNSRGKALKPHDLLKSYHLREMTRESEQEKIALISQWEDTNQNDLENLFRTYLYPVIRWIRNRDGLNYSSDKIQLFKGIEPSNIFNYAIYHKASNIFIEQMNSNELLNFDEVNQFQLTQPIIAGRRFFVWTLHYADLLDQVKDKIGSYHHHNEGELPSRRTGDIYIKQLYEASLLFFADRFGFEAIDDGVMHQLYTWCYSLRVEMKAVYPQTINKYAQGKHERINTGKFVFSLLSEMTDPQELKTVIWDRVELDNQNSKYKEIYELMKEWNGWQ
ncbi:DUF262 domain-containing protein [Streptococcus pantholopis]|uniref:Uncharacterized protein n=1 Tax=Streptococcus pantholopis TaxID=1811193 RepID=A0A172Q716_9STRE|nr:DUF262 domain-containing protein [Streptococcus pantholopis]AND79231.1 hypothetical protein A0O21_03890 [Streptococcus pantholopis]